MRLPVATVALCLACGSSLGPGQRIATLPGDIGALVSSGTKLYARCQPLYDVYEIDPSGGAKRFAPGGARASTSVAVQGGRIYVPTADPGIDAYDATGALVSHIGLASFADNLLADADRLYWQDDTVSAMPEIRAVRIDGTGAIDIGPGFLPFQDDQGLYWFQGVSVRGSAIVRTSKADFLSQLQLAPIDAFTPGMAAGGNVYWASGLRIVTTRADGTLPAPAEAANLPLGRSIKGLAMLDGVLYAATSEVKTYGDLGPNVLTVYLFEVRSGTPHEIARIENTYFEPVLASSGGHLYWAAGADVYRVR